MFVVFVVEDESVLVKVYANLTRRICLHKELGACLGNTESTELS